MFQIESIADLIEDANLATIGQNLFLYHSPADKKDVVILYPSNDPPVIDPDLPGYFRGRFQTIVRNSDYGVGLALCKSLSDELTIFETDTPAIYIKYLRPLFQPRVYRRSESGEIEFSVTFEIRFTEK